MTAEAETATAEIGTATTYTESPSIGARSEMELTGRMHREQTSSDDTARRLAIMEQRLANLEAWLSEVAGDMLDRTSANREIAEAAR
jgi:hypothetical protein